eukprot:UN09227
MANNELSDIESANLVGRKSKGLYGPYGGESDSKEKYNTLKIISTAIICLLFGILVTILYINYNAAGLAGIAVTRNAPFVPPIPPQAPGIPGIPVKNDVFGAMPAAGGGGGGAKRRADRANEAKCREKRCCNLRDDLTPEELTLKAPNLNCKILADEECMDEESFCEWDCDAGIRNG